MLMVEPPLVELDEYPGATVYMEHPIPFGTVKEELHELADVVPD
jgi:hypothetical protein